VVKASVVTFAQLPEEEGALLAYLTKTGDVWARAVADDPTSPTYAPASVGDFMGAHSDKLANNGTVNVYLGFRPDVLRPIASEVEGRKAVDIFASCLIGYTRGEYYAGGELAQSNLFFYRGSFRENEFVEKSDSFLRWAAKVLGWARRHAPEKVPVHRCNYETRATARVAEAAAAGLKVWY
jgi:hypothetical protein